MCGQYQREPITHLVKSQAGLASREVAMLPVTLDDIETANRIAPEVLGRGLDELSQQTRQLLEHIKALVRKTIKTASVEQKLAIFSRRELRDFTSWSQMQVRRHLEQLEERPTGDAPARPARTWRKPASNGGSPGWRTIWRWHQPNLA